MQHLLYTNMENFVRTYLHDHGFRYDPIPETLLPNIYELYHNHIHNEIENDIVLVHYGIYHDINNNHDIMKVYYSRAISFGNTRAMLRMVTNYINSYNFEEALEYILMAIDNDDYTWIRHTMSYCKAYKPKYVEILFNRILNKGFNDVIIASIIELPVTCDMINILVNMNQSTFAHHCLVHLFPN